MISIELRGFRGKGVTLGRVLRLGALLLLLPVAFLALLATIAWGEIPAAERAVLLNLYTSTNGAGWTTSTNWNGSAGTECTWFGVTCDAGATHVTFINLPFNNLTGTLPDLSGVTALQHFNVAGNGLTGLIPALGGLTSLQDFDLDSNALTGPIPALTGLTNLRYFDLDNNQLAGPLPALTGLTNLRYFDVDSNQITGPLPAVTGLTNLQYFWVYNNQLTGPLPALTGLSGLEYFWVSGNQLTGAIPPLSGLTNLQYFDVSSNQLSGNVPAVPSPNNLAGGGSLLCPNFLSQTANAAWDAATGSTPWYLNCTASTLPVRIVETLVSYTDIQSAYNAALNGQTVEAQDGSGSQNPLLFDNPNIVSFKLSGGYNTGFTAATGATRVTGSIGVTRSGVEMEGIIIQ